MAADDGLKMQSRSGIGFYHHVCRRVIGVKRTCLAALNIAFRMLYCHFPNNLKRSKERRGNWVEKRAIMKTERHDMVSDFPLSANFGNGE
jgi:hypothetical protein